MSSNAGPNMEDGQLSNGSRRVRGNRVDYKHSWSLNREEFDLWFQKFKSAKTWQKKHARKDHTQRDFNWFVHNSLRFKKTCKYSKSRDKICEARLKVSTEADEKGQYTLELNSDGCEHFLSEFFPEFHENITSNEITNIEEGSNCDPSSSEQSRDEREKKEWDELSKQLTRALQLSNGQFPKSNTQVESQSLSTDRPMEIISVSENNDRIDWGKLGSNSDLKMVIARCLVGLKLDKEFYYNYRSMTGVNYKQLGAYHHFLGGSNSPTPEEQMQMVIKILEDVGYDKRKHLFAIAVQTEYNGDSNSTLFTARLVAFINLLLQNGFMRPIIYCNNNSWKMLIDPRLADEMFSKLPLWIAHYTDDPSPLYPDTWKSRGIPWWMWQFTDTGLVDGIINHVYISRRNSAFSVEDNLFHSAV